MVPSDYDEVVAVSKRGSGRARPAYCAVSECVCSLIRRSLLQILEKAAEIAGASDCVPMVS